LNSEKRKSGVLNFEKQTITITSSQSIGSEFPTDQLSGFHLRKALLARHHIGNLVAALNPARQSTLDDIDKTQMDSQMHHGLKEFRSTHIQTMTIVRLALKTAQSDNKRAFVLLRICHSKNFPVRGESRERIDNGADPRMAFEVQFAADRRCIPGGIVLPRHLNGVN
jgi:hypothetical protein